MKSQRINEGGKEVATPPFRSEDDVNYQDWEAWCSSKYGAGPVQQHRMWPHPSNDENEGDDGFVAPRARTKHRWANGADYSGSHTPDDYTEYLKRVDHHQIGDYVCYKWHKEDDPMMTGASVRVILFKMPREKMTWPQGQGFPKPFVMANIAGMGRPAANAWVSYEDLIDMRKLTKAEYARFVENNVQLPNYLEQVKDAIKAGKCTVSR